MTKVKATLFGIPERKYKPAKFFHSSVKKPNIEYIEIFSTEFVCSETFEEIKLGAKYNYIDHPHLKRRRIIEKYNLKIPKFIRKLVWVLEEINET